ncbi:ANTAR domain-containing protein [Variovorax fucosicus]|uniref:ANTAR domain-containing protein n=1 Tax=Variovorax fucosicus TaxID=3053517 RepID=UPI0025779069|nr:type IV pili methyl-accepting chemotaxis transducer N-terminal domain-containing protein [Variovorax sp. J22G47]MDM0059197.1 type IV pili methyl-accepting chemotaxis transducer N-terminal domain-containing protein [Variovorax sp. J22G47]
MVSLLPLMLSTVTPHSNTPISLHCLTPGSAGAHDLPEGVRRALADPGLAVVHHREFGTLPPPSDKKEADEAQLLICAPADMGKVLELLGAWAGSPPWPVSLLSPPLDAAVHEELIRAGVHAWAAVDAINEAGLAALLARSRARWRREAALRVELVQLRTRMDERKWVDKAKGLLMLARGMGEDEAFALLRRAAMHANLRLGEVSRSVVDAAQWAEAINRAGQLRMQAQRLSRLAAQALAGVDVSRSREQRGQSVERVQENLGFLDGLGLVDEAAAALDRTKAAWRSLQAAWTPRVAAPAMAVIDAAAEALLRSADALTAVLERASGRRALRIINLCGRQRMLAERLAKDALLALTQAPDQGPGLASTADEFEKALRELENAPLTSPEIRTALGKARDEWLRLARGVQGINRPQGGLELVRSAEALVDTFDHLAAQYEHSVQVIMS